jgi:hypothetical protein
MRRVEAMLRFLRGLPLRLVLPALNVLGAMVVGGWIAGWIGALIGVVVYGVFLAGYALAGAAFAATHAAPIRVPGTAAPVPTVALLPPAMAGEPSLPPIVYRIAAGLQAPFAEPNLPLTVLNVVLLVLLICVMTGIDFAFWLALAAVPIVILGLMMMSLDGQEEQDEEA